VEPTLILKCKELDEKSPIGYRNFFKCCDKSKKELTRYVAHLGRKNSLIEVGGSNPGPGGTRKSSLNLSPAFGATHQRNSEPVEKNSQVLFEYQIMFILFDIFWQKRTIVAL